MEPAPPLEVAAVLAVAGGRDRRASTNRVCLLMLPEAEEAAVAVMAQAVEAAATPLPPPMNLVGRAAVEELEAKL